MTEINEINEEVKDMLKLDPSKMTLNDQIRFLQKLKKTYFIFPITIISGLNLECFDLELDNSNEEFDNVFLLESGLKFSINLLYRRSLEKSIPLYTDEYEYSKAHRKYSVLKMYGEDLANMLDNDEIPIDKVVINPFSNHSITLNLSYFAQAVSSDSKTDNTISALNELLKNEPDVLEDAGVLFLGENEPYLKNQAVDGFFTTEFPYYLSTNRKLHMEYPYLNIFFIPPETRFLNIENMIDTDNCYDVVLPPLSELKLIRQEDSHTMIWKCMDQLFYDD